MTNSVRLTIAVGVASIAMLANQTGFAQQNSGAIEQSPEKIQVSGPHIARPNAVSVSPIMSMSA
ncbi:hypothetical protein BAE46_12720 [Glaciecola punicea]|uniref:hypothetical protein n=1 Tax=Glaciecola punicea TaxID=56804 RepID=UPI00087337C4|nr:hypothetical protein [Glaciecola punicea]OFA30069.1 hypothetical protein BAE46_12720 [Glaciecola punicea]